MTKHSEELGFNNLMVCDYGSHDGVVGNSRHIDATLPLPLNPVSTFPLGDMNDTSQCYINELAGQSSTINSSPLENALNFKMDHQGEEYKHLSSIPDSGFPYQHARPDNLTTPTDVMNAASYLNSFENSRGKAKCVTLSDSLACRSLMVNHIGPAINGNIGQPQPQPLPAEFGIHNPNSGFSCSQGYIGSPHQYIRPDNLMVLNDTANASFNLNSFRNPPSGAKYVTPNDSLVGKAQMENLSGLPMSGNNRQPSPQEKFGLHRPNSSFPCPEGYVGWPSQYTRYDNLMVPDDVGNVAFNLNAFEKPHSGAKRSTQSGSFASSRPQMVNPDGLSMNGNIGQPAVNANFGVHMINGNQGGAEPLLTPGNVDERFKTVGFGSNIDYGSNIPRINEIGNSTGFQNGVEVKTDLLHTGKYEALFDSTPGLNSGPSHALQRPTTGDINYSSRQFNRVLSLGGVNLGRRIGLERCEAPSSAPFVSRQIFPSDNQLSMIYRQAVPSSIGMVNDQSLSRNFASQSLVVHPLAMAIGSTRGQGSSSNHDQCQVAGSMQQSNSSLGLYSPPDLGMQIGRGNSADQISRQYVMPSAKRAASQLQLFSVQGQRKRTLPTHPFIHGSTSTLNTLAPSIPNTPQPIPPFIPAPYSFAPQTYSSINPHIFPATQIQSALSAPNMRQMINPFAPTASFLQPIDKRIPSFQPASHTPHLPNQQRVDLSSAQQRLRAQIMASTTNVYPHHIKYKDPTLEPIGHKCFLCKRDLCYTPEGPIVQPLALPAAAVLPCGHTFHEQCLERITPDDNSVDPPCIPCALGD